MARASDFELMRVQPAAGDAFAFTFLLPADWQMAELPQEQVDFASDPALFMPLGVATANYAAIVLSAAVRPAFDSGTVSEWLIALCERQGFSFEGVAPVRLGHCMAAGFTGIQETEGGAMRMRIALFEDGGRLFSVTVMAPTALWEAVAETLEKMLTSFTLVRPVGSTVALSPGDQEPEIEGEGRGRGKT